MIYEVVKEMALETEMATYHAKLSELISDEGKYVVIFGKDVIGTFSAYEDALKKGYEVAKLAPFLVKKISGTETVAYFSRDFGAECHTKA